MLLCLSCFPAPFQTRRLVSADGQVKSGNAAATDVVILTAAGDRIGGSSQIGTLPQVNWSYVVSNTFSFSGGVGTSEDFSADGCQRESVPYWKTNTTYVMLKHGFVQIAGSDRVRLWGDDNHYRSFHPGWGAYTPFWTREAAMPPGTLIADAVLPTDGPNAGVFSIAGDELFPIDSSTGQTGAKLCSFPPLALGNTCKVRCNAVHTASVPSEKSVLIAKNFNRVDRPNELFLLDTEEGACAPVSWKLQEGEWFCGIAVDQASKKAFVLVEHHVGSLKTWARADEQACQNRTGTVDRISVYEVPLESARKDGTLAGRELLQLPSLADLNGGPHGANNPLVGLPSLFLQKEKIWFLQMDQLMFPIQFAAPKVRAPKPEESFSCFFSSDIGSSWNLGGLPPTIYQGGFL